MVGFLFVSAAPTSLPAGFVEVEFGPLALGRPVQQSAEQTPAESPEEVVESEEPPAPADETEEEGRLVDLPEQNLVNSDPEEVRSPDSEETGATQASTAVETMEEGSARAQQEAREGGGSRGSTGATTGEEGTGVDETKSSPYQLEGLEDRSLTREVLPLYAEKVNAVIQMRITVDPRGQVVRIIPLRKSNPTLERAVMEALRRWRFNALAANVPLENQTGVVTFRFRLE
jgi:protein TonB